MIMIYQYDDVAGIFILLNGDKISVDRPCKYQEMHYTTFNWFGLDPGILHPNKIFTSKPGSALSQHYLHSYVLFP